VTEQTGGMLVVRLWLDDERGGFRARITSGSGAGLSRQTELATDPEQVLDAVAAWLRDLQPPKEPRKLRPVGPAMS